MHPECAFRVVILWLVFVINIGEYMKNVCLGFGGLVLGDG